MKKGLYICLAAVLLSSCANNAQPKKADTTDISAAVTVTTTTAVTTASTTTVSAEEKNIITSGTTVSTENVSKTTRHSTSTSRSTEAVTSQTEVSQPDNTEPINTASVSVSESKPEVTTVSSAPKKNVSQTATEAPIQTTTEKPKDTTTAATTTTTTAAQSGIKWSDSMKVWRKLCEGKNLTGSEQDIIRSEILDYAVSSFNGKKDIHVSFGIDSYDISYEKPLKLTADRKLTDLSNAHYDSYADADCKGMIGYASSEQEIYDIVCDARQSCMHIIDRGLFNRWEIFSMSSSLKYASDISFNVGFDEDMAIWFLTQD